MSLKDGVVRWGIAGAGFIGSAIIHCEILRVKIIDYILLNC